MDLANRRVVINDICCLIDLHKVGLVQPMLALPFDFRVAFPVRYSKLLNMTPAEWAVYELSGIQTIDLPGVQVANAFTLREQHPELSAEDCFSLVLARETLNGLLLTGDAALRRVAEKIYGIEVHGILWIADNLVEYCILETEIICRCLERWEKDPLVHLPSNMIAERLRNWRT